jgi:hypothetical protein
LQYLQLREERPDLFEFDRRTPDEWQIVQAWLNRHQLT